MSVRLRIDPLLNRSPWQFKVQAVVKPARTVWNRETSRAAAKQS